MGCSQIQTCLALGAEGCRLGGLLPLCFSLLFKLIALNSSSGQIVCQHFNHELDLGGTSFRFSINLFPIIGWLNSIIYIMFKTIRPTLKANIVSKLPNIVQVYRRS